MATNATPGDPATGTSETQGQQQAQGEATPGEMPEAGTQGQSQQAEGQQGDTTGSEEQAQQEQQGEQPKDPAKESLLADLVKERNQRKTLAAQVEKLTSDLTTAQAATDERDAVQRKYDRLEEFLTKAGGPLGKALDSRSFTQALFESDKDVAEIATQWHRDNPSATSQALGATGSGASGKPDMGALLRAAAK